MSRILALLAMLAVAVFLAAGLSGCNDDDPLVLPQLTSTPSDPGTYSEGSQVCANCHQAIYQSWEKTRHTKKVREASLATVVNDADSDGTNDFVEGGAGITYNVGTSPPPGQTTFTDIATSPGIDYPFLGWDGTDLLIRIGPNTYVVTYVLGGTGKWKQRYMVTIDNQEYISPVQYNDVTRQYVWYHPENWYTLNTAEDTLTGYLYGVGETPITEGEVRDSWQRRCIGCHTTGAGDLSQTADGEYGLSIADMLAAEQGSGPWLAELPIACEACHGPSQRHVELGGGIGTALNPDTMASDRGDEVCGACHNRGASKNAAGFGFPWAPGSLVGGQFQPGDVLDNFFTSVDRDSSRFWDDGSRSAKSHRQQWIEHSTSPHGLAGVTCWKCHDPHGSGIDGDLRAPPTQLCLSCHDGQGDIDSADLSKHTRHKDPETAACNNCHMVLTAKSAVEYDIPSHTYRVLFPAESETTPGLPNSCAGCHPNESPSQLTSRLAARWPSVRPVAFASSEENSFTAGTFNLLGGQSFDPLGGPITYQWTLLSGPPSFSQSELLAATAETALFVPAAPGNYTFQLVVTNRDGLRSWVALTSVDVDAAVVQTPPDITQSSYVGSNTCRACHRDTHSSWEVTRHTQKVRRPDEGAGVVFADTDEDGTTDWMQGGFNLRTDPVAARTQFDDYLYGAGVDAPIIDFSGGTYTVTVGPVTYDVTWLLGGTGKWKQRYMATIDNGEYILPIQFNEITNEWVVYHLEHWYTWTDTNGSGSIDPGDTLTGYLYNATTDTPVTEGNTNNSWQRRCTACHVTGARDMSQNATTGEYAASIQTMLNASSGPRIAETGIGCEACHGPGSQHTAQPSRRGAIINPSKLSSLRSNEVCGACHNRGSSVFVNGTTRFGFPWGPTAVDGHYIPSLDLDDFYTPVPEGGSRFWDDPYGHSRSHHQQWLDMRWSAHFQDAGMTCATCHTGHEEDFAGQLKQDVVTQCGSCHKDQVDTSGNRWENHSRHPVGVAVCSDCHMPFVAKSAINYDIRAHSFQIIWPEATDDAGIPNSCTDCHPGETTDDLQDDINMLWGDILPYAEPRAIDPSDGEAKRGVTFSAPVTITLDGTKSYDPNGGAIIAYSWTLVSAPTGSSATLSNRFAAQPTIDVTVPGVYTFSLVARDLQGSSRPATLSITVN